MIGLAGIALLVGQASQFAKALPPPTGHNGYEEYIQAIEFISKVNAPGVLSWIPGRTRPAKDPDDPTDPGPTKEELAIFDRLNAMTPLDVRREAVLKFGRSLDLVARGNAKPVFEPRTNMGPTTLFPEYASFKTVTRLASQAGLVYAADGRTDLATKALLDQFWFADNIGRSVIISHLVGVACTSITIVGFQDILPRLSEPDAIQLERTVDALLARPLAVREVIRGELAFTTSALMELGNSKVKPEDLAGDGGDDPESARDAGYLKELVKMTPGARQRLLAGVKTRMQARAAAMDRIFQKPEKDWVAGFKALGEEDNVTPANVSDVLVSLLSPVYEQYVLASLRNRTQMRLLKLYAQAIQYRWEYDKWPEKLNAIDPMNGQGYIYEVHEDDTIRIASKGNKETGEIDLKYKRVAGPDEEVKP